MILINSSPKNALKIFQPFLPIFVPIGVGSIAAVAERQNLPFRIIDEQIEDNVAAEIDKYVSRMDPPYVFAFSVLTVALKSAIQMSAHLKKMYPDSVVIFGGIHPTAMPDEVLGYDSVDLVFRGEIEDVLTELYRCLKGRRDPSHIPGLSYRSASGVVHNERSANIIDIDQLPSFPYHLFDPARYDFGFVVSSRGCPYNCIFCSNRITTGKAYRYRQSEQLIEELKLLYHKYNRRYVLFLDDNLLVSKERIYELIDGLKCNGLDKKMTFNFQARGDNVNPKLLQDMFDAGFRSIFFGMETSSEQIMKTIKKGETVTQCIEAVNMAKKIGFHVSATFVYGFPGETHDDRMKCAALSNDLKLDMVRFNNATPYPGTELYQIAKNEGRLNVQGLYENFVSVSTFIENPLHKIPFSYVPVGSTERQIRHDILYSYFKFYLNKNRLKQVFTRPDQGAGWFNAGEKVKEVISKLPALLVLMILLSIKFTLLVIYRLETKVRSIVETA